MAIEPLRSEGGAQVAQGGIQPEGRACGACLEYVKSSYLLQGACPECGAPVCYKCWARGVRHCHAHASKEPARTAEPLRSTVDKRRPYPPATFQGPVCASCGARVPHGAGRAGAPIYCEACQAEKTRIPESLPPGALSISEAKALESLFEQRVALGLRRLKRWDGLRRRKQRVIDEWSTAALPAGHLDRHPYGLALKPRITELPKNDARVEKLVYGRRKPWGEHARHIHLAVASCADLKTLLEKGFLTEPAGAAALEAVLREARARHPEAVVIAFSPTGWRADIPVTDGAVLVARGAQGDWDCRVHMNDPRVRDFVERVLTPESEDEQVARCVAELEAASAAVYPLSARHYAEEHSQPRSIVVEAFRRAGAKQTGLRLTHDRERDDWLLDLRA